jgi:hypothetical protein
MLERACRCKVERVSQSGSIFNYTIYKYPKKDIERVVSFGQQQLLFPCSCQRFETLGIPCEHVLFFLSSLTLCTFLIVLCYVDEPNMLNMKLMPQMKTFQVSATRYL